MNNDNKINTEINTREEPKQNIQTVTQSQNEIVTTEASKEVAISKTPEVTDKAYGKDTNVEIRGIQSTPPDLKTYYMLTDKGGETVEKPIFSIEPGDSKYVKNFLDRVECIQNTQFPPSTIADPFFDVNYDVGYGRLVGINSLEASQQRTNFRPGIINFVPVVETGVVQHVYGLADGAIPQPTVRPGQNDPSTRKKWDMAWTEVVRRFTQPAYFMDEAQVRAHMPFEMYNGPAYIDNANSFWIRGLRSEVCGDDMSYVTASGADFWSLNINNDTVKNIFNNLRLANLRFNNLNVRSLIQYVYNNGQRDPLAYNTFGQGLKLLLYIDAISTGYDYIENYNSNAVYPFMVDRTRDIEFQENINTHTRAGASQGRIAWCTLNQYMTYQNEQLQPHAAYQGVKFSFVPVKYSSLRQGNLPLMALLVSLFPYPIGTALYSYIMIQPDFVNRQANGFNGVLEPLASKIDIDGMSEICLVIVDPPEGLVEDPNQPAYRFDLFGLEPQPAHNLHIGNLQFGEPAAPDWFNGNLKTCLCEFLAGALAGGPIGESKLLELYRTIEDWEISTAELQFAAMLTTMPINNWYSDTNRAMLPTLQLCNLLPFDQNLGHEPHFYFQQPSFIQMCYKILGLVRQKSVTAVTSLGYQQFRRIMYGNRMVLGACLSRLTAGARNEVPVETPCIGFDYMKQSFDQRQKFIQLFDATFLKSSSTLRPAQGFSPSNGVFRYFVNSGMAPGTVAALIGHDGDYREYCNVEDWANFMLTDLTAEEHRYVKFNAELIKGQGSVQHIDNEWRFIMNEVGRAPNDIVLKMINDMYGRTHKTTRSIVCYGDRLGAIRARRASLPEPIYSSSQLTWNADINGRGPLQTYSSTGDAASFPYIRVIDYVYPVSSMTRQIPLWFGVDLNNALQFMEYIVVQKWDSDATIPYNDYLHVPALPGLQSI